MNRFLIIFTAFIFGITALNALADTTNEVTPQNDTVIPPAQMQKNDIPDSTSTGDYLKTQPDENGATKNTNENNDKNSKSGKKHNKSKSNNLDKSKKSKEAPEDGGMSLENK